MLGNISDIFPSISFLFCIFIWAIFHIIKTWKRANKQDQSLFKWCYCSCRPDTTPINHTKMFKVGHFKKTWCLHSHTSKIAPEGNPTHRLALPCYVYAVVCQPPLKYIQSDCWRHAHRLRDLPHTRPPAWDFTRFLLNYIDGCLV